MVKLAITQTWHGFLFLCVSSHFNGTLFNSEAWQGIKDDEVEMLEKVDEALLGGLHIPQCQ